MRAVVFDLYGTLTDAGALIELAKRYTPQNEAFIADWRHRQLSIAFGMACSKRYENFDVVTERALDEVAPRYFIRLTPQVRGQLLSAWREQPFYDDVMTTFGALRDNGLGTAVLTNATKASATAALARAGALPLVDAVLSVDTVRTFKPHLAVYALATEFFECTPGELIFVSSNDWDASGAAQFGMQSVWCQRPANDPEAIQRREPVIFKLTDVLAIAGVPI